MCRRVFIFYIENGWGIKVVDSKRHASSATKVTEYNTWFLNQYQAFKGALLKFVTAADDGFHAVSIRSFIEVRESCMINPCWDRIAIHHAIDGLYTETLVIYMFKLLRYS